MFTGRQKCICNWGRICLVEHRSARCSEEDFIIGIATESNVNVRFISQGLLLSQANVGLGSWQSGKCRKPYMTLKLTLKGTVSLP